jgi:D-arginine dehydrogenase
LAVTKERIVIIGGGIAGLATARELAEQGGRERHILVLERESAVGRHSSGRSASILRTATADPIEHELARRGADLLRDASPEDFGAKLVDERGLVITADACAADRLETLLTTLDRRIEFERLDAPRFSWDRRQPVLGVRFPREGRIHSERLIQGLSMLAQRAGVWVEAHARVTEIKRVPQGGFEVGLRDAAAIPADRVVIAAGGWAQDLGRGAGSTVSLRPTQRHVAVLLDRSGVPADAPVVWHFGENEFYYRPEGDGLLVCACDETDAAPPPAVDPRIEELLIARSAQHLLGATPNGTGRLWVGCRTLTRDGRVCVGPDPDVDGLFWVAGLAGGGMTCGLEVGRLAARWIDGADEDRELRAALAPGRLAATTARA